MQCFGSSQRQALRVAQTAAPSYQYRPRACDATSPRLRIAEIAATHVHYGNRRVHVMLRREDFKDNDKRVNRRAANGL